MIKEKDKIKVKLGTDGTLEVVCIPVNLNKDSYNYVKLQCLVPKTENSKDNSFVKVYASSLDVAGQNVWTSETYNMSYQKTITINHFDYELYETPMPQEFCAKNGDLELTFAYVTVDADGNVTSLLPSSTLSLYIGFVGGKGYNPSGSQIANADVAMADINTLKKQIVTKSSIAETLLKYDVTQELPENIEYNAEGYKSPYVIYENATFKILDMEDKEESHVGSLLVTRNNNVQSELFIFNQNIAERVLFLNEDNQVTKVGKWSIKVTRQQSKEHIGEFLIVGKDGNITFTKAIKDFITKYNGETLGEDTSSYNFIGAFKITPKSKEEFDIDLSDELKETLNEAATTRDFAENGSGLKFNLTIDPKTYVLTIDLVNSKEKIICSKSIDLPLESMVVSGSYSNGYVTLVLQSGEEVKFSIAALISGLVPTTRTINGIPLTEDVELFIPTKLSDLADDATHRTVTDEEKAYWNDKDYNHLTNLPNIPEGVVVDPALSLTSTNGLQNKVATENLYKNFYNLGAFDTIVDNGDNSVTITRKTGYVELSQLNWHIYDASTYPSYFEADGTQLGLNLPTGNDRIGNIICAGLTTVSYSGSGKVDNTITLSIGNTLGVKLTNQSDVQTLKTDLRGKVLQYELSTEYQNTEQVLKEQPIHTLDQIGEQWLREEWTKGLNILDPASFTKRAYLQASTGNEIASNNDICTDFYQLNSNTYSVTIGDKTDLSYFRVSYYDVNKNYISAVNINDGTSLTIPKNAKYVRFSISATAELQLNQASKFKIIVSEGPNLCPYQPYNGEIAHANDLKVFSPLTTANATKIPANADLNTAQFVNVGAYYIDTDNEASSLQNSPTSRSFTMIVRNILGSQRYPNSTWKYFIRELTDYSGNMWVQAANTQGDTTPVFGNWVSIIRSIGGEIKGTLTFVGDINYVPLIQYTTASGNQNRQLLKAIFPDGTVSASMSAESATKAIHIKVDGQATAAMENNQLNIMQDGIYFKKDKAIMGHPHATYDLNTLYDTGTYDVTQGMNQPSGTNNWGTLLVMNYKSENGFYGSQIWLPAGDDGKAPNSMWFRTCNKGVWNDWQKAGGGLDANNWTVSQNSNGDLEFNYVS